MELQKVKFSTVVVGAWKSLNEEHIVVFLRLLIPDSKALFKIVNRSTMGFDVELRHGPTTSKILSRIKMGEFQETEYFRRNKFNVDVEYVRAYQQKKEKTEDVVIEVPKAFVDLMSRVHRTRGEGSVFSYFHASN